MCVGRPGKMRASPPWSWARLGFGNHTAPPLVASIYFEWGLGSQTELDPLSPNSVAQWVADRGAPIESIEPLLGTEGKKA